MITFNIILGVGTRKLCWLFDKPPAQTVGRVDRRKTPEILLRTICGRSGATARTRPPIPSDGHGRHRQRRGRFRLRKSSRSSAWTKERRPILTSDSSPSLTSPLNVVGLIRPSCCRASVTGIRCRMCFLLHQGHSSKCSSGPPRRSIARAGGGVGCLRSTASWTASLIRSRSAWASRSAASLIGDVSDRRYVEMYAV